MTSTLTSLGVCDYAACKQPATSRAGQWSFCGPHAEDDARLANPEREEPETRPAPPALSQTSVTAPVLSVIEAGRTHRDARARRLAEQITSKIAELHQRMKDVDDQAAARARQERAAHAAKAAARAEVDRLERELAAAKAKLRGKPAAVRADAPGRTEPLPCRKGCGKTCAGAAGRSMHERHCKASAA